MKKIIAAMMVALMMCACCITGCAPKDTHEHVDADPKDGKCDVCGKEMEKDPSEDPSDGEDAQIVGNEIQTDRSSLDYVFNELYKKTTFTDSAMGFNTSEDVTGGRFFVSGHYYDKLNSVGSRQDVKIELYNDENAMMINLPAGQAFAIPAREIEVDYTIAEYRTQYKFGDSVLTYSAETKNPYGANDDPWYVYVNEWAIRHLVNMSYYENQNLELLNKDELGFTITPVGEKGTSDGERAYPTVKKGDLKFRPGYEVYRFDIEIKDAGDIEYPFYNIGIIHQETDYAKAGFFVMKSKENRAEVRDSLLRSWRTITSKGRMRNYFENKDPVPDPNWSEETRAFFDKFSTQRTKSWGVFSYSMPGEEASLHAGDSNYDQHLQWSKEIEEFIENEAWGGKKYDVYMTYTPLTYYTIPQYYPLEMSKELAGGNGFDDKPVLEFTFQYTTNNNLVDQELTPLFDIMRGKYDDYFKRLALDIKEYGKPVMFRLNNEMNTDWTSYSGIMNLLDPDIFNTTWIRLYNIFIENGVDNVIWVWNPVADSAPYSGWGEDLCYFPGFEYVHLLGGTNYEANNDPSSFMTFKDRYGSLYQKNKPYFEKWSMIIGEFACGSGGNASGELGRNRKAQAAWVEGMFEELNAENPAPYAQQIKGLIWFNCNDYSGSLITNRYKFADTPKGTGRFNSEKYDDLTLTWEAFRKGFQDAEKLGA